MYSFYSLFGVHQVELHGCLYNQMRNSITYKVSHHSLEFLVLSKELKGIECQPNYPLKVDLIIKATLLT